MQRYKKSLSERIYLLSVHQYKTDHWKFTVRGQSNNVYKQEILHNHYNCSCPDYAIRRSFCKHLLFLISRVANIPDTAKNLCINLIKWNSNIFTTCANNWLDRLKGRLDNISSASNNINNDCSICFEEMQTGETFSQCITTCKNYFHEGCLKLWLNAGHNTCPLCRAEWVEENQRNNNNDDIWQEINKNRSSVMLINEIPQQNNTQEQDNYIEESLVEHSEVDPEVDPEVAHEVASEVDPEVEPEVDPEVAHEVAQPNLEIKLSLNEKVIDLCRRFMNEGYNYHNIYYEFIRTEHINFNRDFILIDKNSLNTIRGDIVKELLGLNNIVAIETVKPIYLQDYYVFINCISKTKVLCENHKYINLI